MVVVAPSTELSSDGERAAAASAAPSPPAAPCWECGAALSFTVHPDKSVDAVCTSCEASTHLAVAAPEGESDDDDEEEDEHGDVLHQLAAGFGSKATFRRCDKGAKLSISQ